jgi:PPOX class probable FMN-dependent enzyme
MTEHEIDDAGLHRLYDAPTPRAAAKVLDRLDRHCRRFIALSPFLVLGTAAADGRADVSPRGDPPGFVGVLDDRTIVIPDRPGNNRIDSMSNIVANPNVAAIFFVPGVKETLRVNGKARVSTDPDLLSRFAVNGKPPKCAIVVSVEEAFLHCAKALMRSGLWDPDKRIDRREFPSMGEMLADHTGLPSAHASQEEAERSYRDVLY